MARQPRIEFPGALYHVISRGIERRDLFSDDADRTRYLSILEKSVDRFGFHLFSYCLMGNHVHLALEVGRIPISRIMKSINTTYAGYFNARHRRSGYLFQGRYKAFLVEKDEYFLSLVRYIHENPVQAGIVGKPGDFRWSSHHQYLGKAPRWLDTSQVLLQFGRRRQTAMRNFAAFFCEEEARPYVAARRYVQTVVGEEDFARQVLETPKDEALVVRQWKAGRLIRWLSAQSGVKVAELAGPGRRRGPARWRAIGGYLGREVARIPISQTAREVARDPSSLWRDVERLEESTKKEPGLKSQLAELGKHLAIDINNT
jgi:putative transposase